MLPTRRRALGALASGLFASTAYGQKNPPDIVAGIPVNYDEARVGTYTLPAAGQPILHTLGYVMHSGGHGTVPSDWDVYLKFLQMHLQPVG